MDSSEERDNLWEVQSLLSGSSFPWGLARRNDRRPLSTSTPRSTTRRPTVERSTSRRPTVERSTSRRTETHRAVTATSIDYNLRCSSTTNCITIPPSPRRRDWSPTISPIRNRSLGRSPDRVANPYRRLSRHVDSSTSSPLINPFQPPTLSSTRLCRSAHSDIRSPTRPPPPNRDHSPRQPLGLGRLRSAVKAAFCKRKKSTTSPARNRDTSGIASFRKSVQRTWSSSRNRFPPYSRPRPAPKTRLGNTSTRSWKPNLNAVRLGIDVSAQYVPSTRLGPDVDEDPAESLTSTTSTTSSDDDSAASDDVVSLRLDEVALFLEDELRERVARGAYVDALTDFTRAFESIGSGRDSNTELHLVNEYINAMSNFSTVIDSLRSVIDPLIEPNAVRSSSDHVRVPSPRGDLEPDDNVRGQRTTRQGSQPGTQSQERIRSPSRSSRLHHTSAATLDDSVGQGTIRERSQLSNQSQERMRSPNRSSRLNLAVAVTYDDNIRGQRTTRQCSQPRTQSQESVNPSDTYREGNVARMLRIAQGGDSRWRYHKRTPSPRADFEPEDNVRGHRTTRQCSQPRTESQESVYPLDTFVEPNAVRMLRMARAKYLSDHVRVPLVPPREDLEPVDNVRRSRTPQQCSHPRTESQESINPSDTYREANVVRMLRMAQGGDCRWRYHVRTPSHRTDLEPEDNASGQRTPRQVSQPGTQSQEQIRSPNRSSHLNLAVAVTYDDNRPISWQRTTRQRSQLSTESQVRMRSPNRSSCLNLTSAVTPEDNVRGQRGPRERSQPRTQSQEQIRSPNRSSRLNLASAVTPEDNARGQRTTRQGSQPGNHSEERTRSPNRSSRLYHALELSRARLNYYKIHSDVHVQQWQDNINNLVAEEEFYSSSDSQDDSTNHGSRVGLHAEDMPIYRYANVLPGCRESTVPGVPGRRHRYRSPSTNPAAPTSRSARTAAHDIVQRVITDTLSTMRRRRSPPVDASTVFGSRSHARDVPVRRVSRNERDTPSGSSRRRGEPVTSEVTSASRLLHHPDPTGSDEFLLGFIPLRINVLRVTRATNILSRELMQLRQEHRRCLTACAACPNRDVDRPPLDDVLRRESEFESQRQRSLLQCLHDLLDDLRLNTGADESELLQVGALRQRIIDGIHSSCLVRRELHQFQREHSSYQSSRVAPRHSEIRDRPSQTDVSRGESSPEGFAGEVSIFDAQLARNGLGYLTRPAVSDPDSVLTLVAESWNSLGLGVFVDQDSADQAREASPIVQNQYTDQEVASLSMDDLCKVCMNAPVECAILECGHMATCQNCGERLMRCPICRQRVVRLVRVFKS